MSPSVDHENTLRILQDENQRLKRAVEELSILNDLAREIGASLNTQEIIQTIVRRSLRAMNAKQGVMTLVDERQDGGMKTLIRTMVSSIEQEQFHFHDVLLGWMHLNKKPLVIDDVQSDERFHGIHWDESVHSIVSVPMVAKSELRGVLTVYNKNDGKRFCDDDQRLLSIIATQSAQVVENARLYEKEQVLIRMQEEVRLASKIQLELLPKHSPSIPGYEIAGRSIPAQTVGGDYFDFIAMDNHRIAICLGDVSGKGLPASLLMANLQATLRGQVLFNDSPKKCLKRSNRLLFQSTSDEKFATLFYGILDPAANAFSFTNAGHDRPYFLRDGKTFQRLEEGGIPLGIMEDFDYEEGAVTLDVGDAIVIYSDGITEAMNASDEEFSDTRIGTLVNARGTRSVEDLAEQLLTAVKIFAGVTPQSDDMTVVVLKRVK